MVALAVRVLGGRVTPSLARPMLQAAAAAYLAGYPIEAAVKLQEAIRRYLAACCTSHALDSEGRAAELLQRLTEAGADPGWEFGNLLLEAEDVLSFRDATCSKYFGNAIQLAFALIETDNRGSA